MNKSIFLGIITCIAGTQDTIQASYKAKTELTFGQSLATTSLLVAATGACCYIVYKVGSWLFGKSDEQILKEAKHTYKEIFFYYQPFFAKWDPNIAHSDNEAVLVNNWNLLHEFGYSSLYDFTQSLESKMQSIDSTITTLQLRIKKLTHHHTIQAAATRRKLKALILHLKQLKSQLAATHSYFHPHRAYAELLMKVEQLSKEYHRECTILETYKHDEDGLNRNLARLVFLKKNTHQHHYPYKTYIEAVENDIKYLQRRLSDLKRPYPLLRTAAQALINALSLLAPLLVLHPEYHQELRDYQRNQLEKQKIEIERERLRCEEQKARALEHQAAALARQASELAHRNWIEMKKTASQK